MKETKKRNFLIYFVVISMIIFIIALLRAIKISITFDEAITYMNFIDINNIKQLNYSVIANNHILNSFLIFLIKAVTRLEYNEFIIRIPNLVFYLIYIIFTYKISCLYKNKYTVATLLMLNYSVNEFSSLARGYGMASALILVSIYYYKIYLKEKKESNLIKTFIMLFLASLANTINLIVFIIILIDSTFRMIKEKKFRKFFYQNKIKLIILFFLYLFLIIYHFFVSYIDENLAFCNLQNDYTCLIQNQINYYGIDFINNYLVIFFFLFSFFILLIKRKNIKFSSDNISYVSVFIILFLLIAKYIFPFNIPSGRTLIPFCGIYIISLIDFFSVFNYNKMKYVYIIMIIICFFSFFKKVNINYVREWKDDENMKKIVSKIYKSKTQISINDIGLNQLASFMYYYKKYKKMYSYELMSNEEYNMYLAILKFNNK